MSTYSSSLRIELITTGDQAGTWGNTTNTNLGTLIESGICGYTSVAVSSANQALTALNGAADESRNMVLALTTSTGAAFAVYAPPAEKVYVIYNASAYTATIYNSTVLGNTTAAGTGVSIPAGRTVSVWSDGTNFAVQNDYFASLSIGSMTLGTPLAVTSGGTGSASASGARTNLGLGTMATQNANTVNITGGNISGITDLAVADGGTGASTASGARTNLGLGTMSTQDSSNIGVTGGSISGTTIINLPVPMGIADGGTGATTASAARSNLGVTATGQDTTYAYRANNLSDLASASSARTNLGLGSLATLSSINNSNWSGTALTVPNGGTGATTLTNGGILRGNGTGAISTAASIDIVAAIGTTAVINATNATNAINATQITATNWTVLESGGVLFFRYGGVNKAKLDSSGNLTVTGNVTAYGTV